MKGLYKWVGVFVAILVYVLMLRGTEAEAATTSDGLYYPDLLNEVDLGDLREQIFEIVNNGKYIVVSKPNAKEYYYMFAKNPVYPGWYSSGAYGLSNSELVVNVVSYEPSNGRVAIKGRSATVFVHSGSVSYAIGSNYDYRGGTAKLSECPYENIEYPYCVPSGPSFSVDIAVNGTDYTVSEPYPYYLALKEPSGDVQLFFSDVPFTGSFADLYNWRIEIPSDANVVWYYWDSEEQNDFLSSRTVATSSTAFDSFYFTSAGDYMSNYSLPKTNNPLYYFLTEKAAFNPEALTAKDLYAALPDELSKYYHIIIFRQDSPNAYDSRILFYGWNDNNANLYIHSSNSQIAALNKKGAVSEYATAYYDESLNTWVVSDDVVLGATTDWSYNVPYIYHSDLDLFVCDEWNVWNGKIAYPGDDARPLVSFEEPVPDEDESLLESIIGGFKKLFVSLFVPSDGFFAARVNEISSNFSFWTSVRDTIAVFLDFLKETDFSEPPKVQIDLASVKSKVSYGGKVYILDFSFYEPYKESVDVILSAIMWLVFAWNTYKNLPNIISGIGGGVQASASLLDDGKEE